VVILMVVVLWRIDVEWYVYAVVDLVVGWGCDI